MLSFLFFFLSFLFCFVLLFHIKVSGFSLMQRETIISRPWASFPGAAKRKALKTTPFGRDTLLYQGREKIKWEVEIIAHPRATWVPQRPFSKCVLPEISGWPLFNRPSQQTGEVRFHRVICPERKLGWTCWKHGPAGASRYVGSKSHFWGTKHTPSGP